MMRKFTCYIVFVTFIWSAYTDDEKKIPDINFKSDMTRKDFSNLLLSLIKLNEKRVDVLQKLYRLEDYGFLSKVLRSGDDKNANPSNLYLIVLSKGPVDAKQIVKQYQMLLDDTETPPAEDKDSKADDDEKLYEPIGLVTLAGLVDAKQIVKQYQMLIDDTETPPAEDKDSKADDDEKLYELLGLVTLESNQLLTRRTIDDRIEESADNKNESDDHGDILELRSHDKSRKSHHSNKNYESKRKERKHNVLREGEEIEKKVKKELKAQCVSEIDNKVTKCIQACHRTHEDVCSRLACSVRSRTELRKECGNSCRQTFVPDIC